MSDIRDGISKAVNLKNEREERNSGRKNCHELLHAVLRRMHLKLKIRAKTFFGDPMLVCLPEFASCTIQQFGILDSETPLFMNYVLKHGMTFLDIGAHYGFYSLLARKLAGNEGRVYSFEPTPDTFAMLSSNLSQFSNVTLEQMAISNEDGEATFIVNSDIAAAFNHLERTRHAEDDESRIAVPCRKLDTYCAGKGIAPDLIKLDVEGAELDAVKGARQTIERHCPAIVLEFGMSDGFICAPAELLEEMSYLPFGIEKGQLRQVNREIIAGCEPGANYLFIHRSKVSSVMESMS